ncbi:MAG: amidase [Bryobacteraceae bacterium]|nr:amidase [Bryobacteraceae bacterium]
MRLLLLLLLAVPLPAAFEVTEATIAGLHAAIQAGEVTCRQVVAQYLRRIAAYDKNGPALNSLVVLNEQADVEAAELDRRFAQSGLTGPLHCVPMIVKDNFATVGMQSAAGSLSLAGFVARQDAFQVKRVKEAGALILAKSNMAEFAFSPVETVSSILPGYTRNPYALDRVTAGSSGGTAAAIAASFGLVGLSTDTGNSIRGPSAHQALAGIRSTMGRTSRAGIFPLNLLADIAGPMARTVEDAARVLAVIVGEDSNDEVTSASRGRPQEDYLALSRDGLRGVRLGILRQAYERDTADAEVLRVFSAALGDLRQAGATVVDGVKVELPKRPAGSCMGFHYDLDRFLASLGDAVPVKSLSEVVKSRKFHPSVQVRLEQAEKSKPNGPESAECVAEMAYRRQFREALQQAMAAQQLDGFVYPTWSNPPRLIGDLNTPGGDNSQVFSPTSGFPAVNVPMGYTRGTLPAGITFLGAAWSERQLLRWAYSYEQATRWRHAPASTPPLR